MTTFTPNQRVQMVNALRPTFGTVTRVDEKYVYAKLDEGGPEYQYYPNMLALVEEEVVEQHAQAKAAYIAQVAEQERNQPHMAIPASFQVNADWLCQECGHTWNGESGSECPSCGEEHMIVSPRGRE